MSCHPGGKITPASCPPVLTEENFPLLKASNDVLDGEYGSLSQSWQGSRSERGRASPLNECPRQSILPPAKIAAFAIGFLAVIMLLMIGGHNRGLLRESGMLSLYTHSSRPSLSSTVARGDITTTLASRPTFTMTRSGYEPLFFFDPDRRISYLQYKILENYTGIIEPYTENDLFVFDKSDIFSRYYSYSICYSKETGSNEKCHTGILSAAPLSSGAPENRSVKIGCKARNETFTIEVTTYSLDGMQIGDVQRGSLMCMYVRRELRELTEEHLASTLDAVKALYVYDEDEGRSMYGPDFHGIEYFSHTHFFGATDRSQDRLHFGLGFMSVHFMLTDTYEKALQAVDPSVSVFFWDYTIETSLGLHPWESPMFTPDTFGTLAKPKNGTWGWTYKQDKVEDARILDGRWENLTADRGVLLNGESMAYGYLRSPWNLNPSPYLSRFTSLMNPPLPSCDDYYSWMDNSDIGRFLELGELGPHKFAHQALAGYFGCDAFDGMREAGFIRSVSDQTTICSEEIPDLIRDSYHSGYLNARPVCELNTEDTTSSICGFVCDPEFKEDLRIAINITLTSYSDAPWEKNTDAWYDFICFGDAYRVFLGEQLEGMAAADPYFWHIHPALDRAAQAKFMVGGFYPYEWPTNASESWICSFSSCYHSDTKTTYYDPECCRGHYGYDFPRVVGNDGTNLVSITSAMTNWELLLGINPASENYAMPYIYSSFKWEHCSRGDDDGDHDIDRLLSDTVANRASLLSTK